MWTLGAESHVPRGLHDGIVKTLEVEDAGAFGSFSERFIRTLCMK
jgi:hypothetical protein